MAAEVARWTLLTLALAVAVAAATTTCKPARDEPSVEERGQENAAREDESATRLLIDFAAAHRARVFIPSVGRLVSSDDSQKAISTLEIIGMTEPVPLSIDVEEGVRTGPVAFRAAIVDIERRDAGEIRVILAAGSMSSAMVHLGAQPDLLPELRRLATVNRFVGDFILGEGCLTVAQLDHARRLRWAVQESEGEVDEAWSPQLSTVTQHWVYEGSLLQIECPGSPLGSLRARLRARREG